MMDAGRVLVAEHQGFYVIKLIGDVRLTCCTSLDEFTEKMFHSPNFISVIIDLSAAQNIDSTTLGLLAKLAITARKEFQLTPVILSTNPNITRILDTMGFDAVFTIRQDPLQDPIGLAELIGDSVSEAAVREKVIEAHKVLMGMNDKNQAEFRDLVSALEASR